MDEVTTAKAFLEVAFYAAIAGLLLAAFDAYILPRLPI
jgi:hypothetical protein